MCADILTHVLGDLICVIQRVQQEWISSFYSSWMSAACLSNLLLSPAQKFKLVKGPVKIGLFGKQILKISFEWKVLSVLPMILNIAEQLKCFHSILKCFRTRFK